MNRIAIPAADQTPAAALPMLDAVQKQLGVVPNLMKLLASSPAALQGYLGLNAALAGGALGARTGERIALAIAEFHGCQYCLAAHSYLGQHVAGLDAAEIGASRAGASADARAGAALRFALGVARGRGRVADADLAAARAAGYSSAQLLEIVLHVALNTLTNYVNEVAQTELDFPAAAPLAA